MFAFRSVVLPWLLARLLVVPALIVDSPPDGKLRVGNLLAMDGNWFRLIALDWYDRPYRPGGFSEYPFFPLFPAAGGALMRVGVPSTVALAGLAWIGGLLALAGARLLATAHLGSRTGNLVPWVISLSPGGLSLILGYSDAFYLAGLIWAVYAVERQRWLLAGLLAAVATASRPNGVIAVVVIVVIAIGMRATLRQIAVLVAPAAAVLLGWMVYLDVATGDAFVFWSSKAGWAELTLIEFVTDLEHQPLAMFHVGVFLVFVVPYVMRWRRQPAAWSTVVILGVLPALALGVIGLARYSVLAFPLAFAAADLLADRRRWIVVSTMSVSTAALVIFARLVIVESWIP
jgi:hypothetical protein